MGVKHKAVVGGDGGRVGNVSDLAISESITPLVAGDSAGSLPQITLVTAGVHSGPIHKRSGGAVDEFFTLVSTFTRDDDSVVGESQLSGTVRDVSMPGMRANLNIESVMARLNAERIAAPHYGTPRPDKTMTSVRTNLHTNPSRSVDLTTITSSAGTGGTAALTREVDGGYIDESYSRVTWSVAASANGGIGSRVTGLTPGVAYSMLEHYRVTKAGVLNNAIVQLLTPRITYYNTSDTALLSVDGTPVRMYNGQWRAAPYPVVTAPAGTVSAVFEVVALPGEYYTTWAVGDTLDSDATTVENGRVENFFDGARDNVVVDTSLALSGDRAVSKTYEWLGNPGVSQSRETTVVTEVGQNYTATEATAFRYYCGLVGITNTAADEIFEQRAVAYKGWSGNVWKYLKDFCAAVGGEIALVNDVVTLRAVRQRELKLESIDGLTAKVTMGEQARYVDITNYETRWGIDEVYYRDDTVLQVPASGYTEAVVTFDHDIVSINQPECVLGYDPAYMVGPGQYSVTDSQGLPVPPSYWRVNGGQLVVEPVFESTNSVRISLRGPRDNRTYVGPYQIGWVIDGSTVASLILTGSGVFSEPKVIPVRTGVSDDVPAQDRASTIDNIFITDRVRAFDRGVGAATRAAGPLVTITGSISYTDLAQSYGMLIGARVKIKDNVFRIIDVSYSGQSISFSAEADMTFGDLVFLYSYPFARFNELYSTLNFGQFDTLQGPTITFGEFAADFGAPSFEDFNMVFEGASFVDHAIYPYVNEVYDAEPAPI